MSGPGIGYQASGNIYPCRFVKSDGTNYGVEQAIVAGELALGVAQEALREYPHSSSSAYAAISGDPIRVHQAPEECLIEYGAAVTAGDELAVEVTTGHAIPAVSGDYVMAIALETGSASGERHRCRLVGPYQKN